MPHYPKRGARRYKNLSITEIKLLKKARAIGARADDINTRAKQLTSVPVLKKRLETREITKTEYDQEIKKGQDLMRENIENFFDSLDSTAQVIKLELEHILKMKDDPMIGFAIKLKAAREFKRHLILPHKNLLKMAQILGLKKLITEVEKDLEFYESYNPKDLIYSEFTPTREQGDEINANLTTYRELEQSLKQEYEGGWISKETYLSQLEELKKEYY